MRRVRAPGLQQTLARRPEPVRDRGPRYPAAGSGYGSGSGSRLLGYRRNSPGAPGTPWSEGFQPRDDPERSIRPDRLPEGGRPREPVEGRPVDLEMVGVRLLTAREETPRPPTGRKAAGPGVEVDARAFHPRFEAVARTGGGTRSPAARGPWSSRDAPASTHGAPAAETGCACRVPCPGSCPRGGPCSVGGGDERGDIGDGAIHTSPERLYGISRRGSPYRDHVQAALSPLSSSPRSNARRRPVSKRKVWGPTKDS
jgi:hypothetical protein